MERLESALAKARKARLRAQSRPGTPGAVSRTGSAAPTDGWAALAELKISPRQAERSRLVALTGTAAAAPYDILRARIWRQMKQAGWHRLAVTSPNKACGKTTVSANLAFSLARQPELRVMLMDFDLRRPMLASLLGRTERHSLADLLEGRIDFASYAVRYGNNLAICSNRSPMPQSAELLQSPATGEFLSRIEAQWAPDVIIFDTPPLLGNDDNLGFLGHVDCGLLVTAAGSTTLAQIDSCEQELASLTNVVGTVLNKCRFLDDAHGYDYAY